MKMTIIPACRTEWRATHECQALASMSEACSNFTVVKPMSAPSLLQNSGSTHPLGLSMLFIFFYFPLSWDFELFWSLLSDHKHLSFTTVTVFVLPHSANDILDCIAFIVLPSMATHCRPFVYLSCCWHACAALRTSVSREGVKYVM
jgi:hypothetical protein